VTKPRKLVIQPNGLFHTPESPKELYNWLGGLSNVERAAAVTAAGMAWNLACKQVREHNESLDREALQNPYAHIDPDKEEKNEA